MSTRPVRILTRFGLASLAVMVLVGCPEDAADIVEIRGTSLDFAVAPLAPIPFPAGDASVNRLTLAAFDTTVPGAFARETGVLGTFNAANFFEFPAYSLAPMARNGSTDQRLPALADDDAAIGDFCVLGSPPFAGVGEGFWDLFCEVENLKPNTRYTVMMVRYSLQVNAELDAAAVLLGEPVTAPDELTLLGGAPGGYPTVECNFTVGVTVVPNFNPFVVGFVDTDGNGFTTIDCVPVSSAASPTWWRNFDEALPAGVEDSIPFSANTGVDGADLAIPSYNYLVLVEGQGTAMDPVPAGPHAMRWQVGNDLTTGNEGINNAVGPMPAGPATVDALVAAPGGAGRPDSLTVEFLNLQSLASGAVWQAWLVNRAESPPTMAPATGTYERVAILREFDPITGELLSEADSVIDTTAGISSFSGQLGIDLPDVENRQDPAEIKHRLVLSDASVSGDAPGVGFFTDVVLTIEPGGPASTPSEIKPVWFEFTDQNGTPANFFDDVSQSGSLLFGEFDPADPAASRVVTAAEFVQSTGLGGVLTDGAATTAVSVDIKNLPLPPRGFYYEGWLTNAETGETMSMGPITSLPPDTVSLLDADIDSDLPGVIPTGIRFGNAFVEVDPGTLVDMQVAGMDTTFTVNLTSFFLTLEPKVGVAAKNVADVELGTLPSATIISRMGNP